MSPVTYPYLFFSFILLLFVREELVAKLRKQFRVLFPDHDRSFAWSYPSDPGFKCHFMIEKLNRRCLKELSLEAKDVASTLKLAIIASPTHPAVKQMLLQYSQLCHCQEIHQADGEANTKSIQSLAKRWEVESGHSGLVPSSQIVAAVLTSSRMPGHFLDEAENPCSEIDDALTEPGSLPPISLMTPPSDAQDYGHPSYFDAGTSPYVEGRAIRGVDLPSNFALYRPSGTIDPLHFTAIRSLSEAELEAGHVYIMIHPGYDDFMKIGYTSRQESPARRVQQWRDQCKIPYICHTRSFPTPMAKRVESLIHADLWSVRYKIYNCNCRTKVHVEYFKITPAKAEQVINYWINWISEVNPYKDKTLTPECTRWMFHDPSWGLDEVPSETERRDRFLVDSNREPWVDHTSVLGKVARRRAATSPPQRNDAPAATVGNLPPSPDPSPRLRRGQGETAPRTFENDTGYPTPPQESSHESTTSRHNVSTNSEIVPESENEVVGRRLFVAQSHRSTSSPSSALSLPISDNGSDNPSSPSTSSRPPFSGRTHSTPTRPSGLQRRIAGRRETEIPDRAHSAPDIASVAQVQQLTNESANIFREDESWTTGTRRERPPNHPDEVENQDRVISPLHLPSPPVRGDEVFATPKHTPPSHRPTSSPSRRERPSLVQGERYTTTHDLPDPELPSSPSPSPSVRHHSGPSTSAAREESHDSKTTTTDKPRTVSPKIMTRPSHDQTRSFSAPTIPFTVPSPPRPAACSVSASQTEPVLRQRTNPIIELTLGNDHQGNTNHPTEPRPPNPSTPSTPSPRPSISPAEINAYRPSPRRDPAI